MSGELAHLFANNVAWAERMRAQDPEFFDRLSHQQSPELLWIGCSDSRVPANQIIGMLPGDVFVHRNVANIVAHSDLNCLSAVQFAVDVLRVRHVIVTGHYGCGGVRAAMDDQRYGLVDNWLRHVHDVRLKHKDELAGIDDADARAARLCELNVIDQVENLQNTTTVVDAWARGQELTLHGWIYDVSDGLLRDLRVTASGSASA
ncbi:MAG: carbonate dehydratase [Verrucomicrobiota bacterium]|nr:carbonate dehydratase [Verrucomicrobiota bacterium]